MQKDVVTYLRKYSDDLIMSNKLIVGAYLAANNIEVKHNKLILDCIKENDVNIVQEFTILILNKNGKYELEDVTELFETTIPSGDVVSNGAVYTPKYIKDYIVSDAIKSIEKPDLENATFSDIACGTGAFLQTVAEQLKQKTNKSYYQIFAENIYGLDISDYTIERAKILLALLAISKGEDVEQFSFNLHVGNALNYNWDSICPDCKGFDAVIGNPPYVRAKHISEESLNLMQNWEVTKSGNPDLYIPFFEIGLNNLKESGYLGFITVNTFKRSVNARNLRDYFKSNKLNVSIIDFGSEQIFENKSTYTCIVSVSKKKSDNVSYVKACSNDIRNNSLSPNSEIKYKLLNTNKGWLLNKNGVIQNIEKLENTGISLGNKYPIKNGLATLSNDIFIFKPVDEDDKYYYHQNGKLHKIEKEICRDIIKPNRLKSETEIPDLKEKIIFPYQSNDKQLNMFEGTKEKLNVIEEKYFQDSFPKAYEYLKHNQQQLFNRDKGKPKKYKWFEFGRSQAINDYGKKLLFPYMSSQPYFVYTSQKDLLLYAGYAIFCESERELQVLKRILESDVFWYYIKNTSKPYSGNFFALAKNYVKDFSICNLTEEEEDFLLKTSSLKERNGFLTEKYEISI
ncbi:MAG: SAM-dependent DNA methyltransferase [Candidatus Delongbacteria bacterium]|nr:SAM-dependent DNA methyltransferase [Candidatus Delongbacteria bacterium]